MAKVTQDQLLKKVGKKAKPKKEEGPEPGFLLVENKRYRTVEKEEEGRKFEVVEETPAGERDGRWWFCGQGNTEAKVMVLLDSPKPSMSRQGVLDFTGEADDTYRGPQLGVELRQVLRDAGFDLDVDLFITCAQKFILPKGNPTSLEKAKCREMLVGEIREIKPKLIIALGSDAFKLVMNKNQKISDFMGQLIPLPEFETTVLPTHSVTAVGAADPTLRPEWREHVELGRKFAFDQLKFKPFDFIVINEIEVVKTVISHYLELLDKEVLWVGYDKEWIGKKWNVDEVVHTFQFSAEEGKAIVIDTAPDNKAENKDIWPIIKPFIEHPNIRRLGWNIRADDKRLRFRKINTPDSTLAFDGMKACSFFDSRWSKGLETGVMKFTEYGPYYTELNLALKKHKLDHSELCMLKGLEPDGFFRYCAGGAVSHRTACLNMMKALPPDLHDLYYNTYLPLGQYLLDMEYIGCPMDQETMEVMTTQYQNKYAELEAKLKALVARHPYNLTDFNPSSAPAKVKLLFEIMKLEPQYYTYRKKIRPRAWYEKQKPQKQSECRPSANNKSLSSLLFILKKKDEQKKLSPNEALHMEVVETLLSANRVGVFANKFFSKQGLTADDNEVGGDEDEGETLKQSYWASISPTTGHIHTDFFECLDNFRCSSRPNIQNPASKVLAHIPDIYVPGYSKLSKEEQKVVDKKGLYPGNVRHVFWPNIQPATLDFLNLPVPDDDDEWLLLECDVAGADLAIMAHLSGDQDFIHDMLKGGFHETKMRQYFQDEKLTKKEAGKYVIAKSITFRISYSATLESAAEPIQADIFAENGLYVDLDMIKYALGTWKKYKTYMHFRDRCTDQVLHFKKISSPHGPELLFEESEDSGHLASWQNQSLAFPVASGLAWYMHQVVTSMRKFFMSEGLWMKDVFPVNYVHDACYLAFRKKLLKDNWMPEVVKHFFCVANGLPNGAKLGVEMGCYDRWKGQKLFEAETKWDFDKGLWVFKEGH